MVEHKFKQNKYVFSFVRKVSVDSDDLIAVRSRFQIAGAATEKAPLPIFCLVLGTNLRVLERSEKCSRVTKYVGC